MSNEELVVMIQAGETERMGELWEQVRRFVVQQARRVPLEGRADVELDDLIQSGYPALVDAVAGYQPGEYGFLTHLTRHLKSAFAEATRFRTARQQRETLAGTLSLDAPVTDETSASILGDFQEDPAGAEALENAENRIYREQLRKAVTAVLADLPEDQRELVHRRYWEGATLAELAESQRVAIEVIRQKEKTIIQELRKPRNAFRLIHFYDFDYYSGTGLNAFRHSGQSIQERYLIREEQQKELRRKKAENERARHCQREIQQAREHADSMARANKLIDEYFSHLSPEEKAALTARLTRYKPTDAGENNTNPIPEG